VASGPQNSGDGVTDLGQEVESDQRVAGLTFGNERNSAAIREALDVGLLREVEVPAVRLALPANASFRFSWVLLSRSGRASMWLLVGPGSIGTVGAMAAEITWTSST